MALTPLTWKYVGTRTPTTITIDGVLDAIYTLGQATTYANGATRTPGTADAWTWAREQITGVTEAAYGNPPTNALGMRYIVAGATAARAYTMLSPDSATQTNTLVVGMNRGSGAYSTWFNAQPFTSGFSGYWRASRAFASMAYDRVSMWESAEGCVLQIYAASLASSTSLIAMGALIDPMSTAAGVAETDGRVYCLSAQGSTSNLNAGWGNIAAADGGFFGHYTVSGTAHFGAFNNASTTVTGLVRQFLHANIPSGWANRAGEIPRVPVQVGVIGSNYWGQLREMQYTTDANSVTTWRYLGLEQGYIVAYHPTTNGDAMFLKA